jgi:hypothetical protein
MCGNGIVPSDDKSADGVCVFIRSFEGPFAVTSPPPQEKRNAPGVLDTGRALIAPFHYDFVGGFMDVVSLSSSTCLVRLRGNLNYPVGAGAAGWVV